MAFGPRKVDFAIKRGKYASLGIMRIVDAAGAVDTDVASRTFELHFKRSASAVVLLDASARVQIIDAPGGTVQIQLTPTDTNTLTGTGDWHLSSDGWELAHGHWTAT